MVKLFYITYICVDLAHDKLFCAKVGKGGIKITHLYTRARMFNIVATSG